MIRSSFIKTCLTVVSLLATPFVTLAQQYRGRIKKGIVVKAGKDRNNKPLPLMEGDIFFTKVSAKDTDGDVYVFESIRTKEGGPSYHYHYEQDEFWYVLKGEFLFKVGDEEFTAKEGDSVFGPRMVPHTFSKVGEGEARLLMFFQPAGKMEEAFEKMRDGSLKNMTEEEMDKFRHEHGFKKVGPALKYFKKW